MDITNIISLLCGVSLFLFGMLLMGEGLKKVAGNKLEFILYKLSNTPLKGVLLGIGVTTIIQSSSATSVMVVGFVNSRIMKVRQAICVVLGSIFGTSITGWIICLSNVGGSSSNLIKLLSTTSITGIIAVIGIILRMFCKSTSKKNIGDILLGFSILMTGMTLMSSSVSPLRESKFFLDMLTSFKNPFIGIIVGLIITAVIQSASAAIGILQALSTTGMITFDIAFPLIMGISLGAALPVLLSALGSNISGKRVSIVYLIINAISVTLIGSLFYIFNFIFKFSIMNLTLNMITIALINTIFRFIILVLLGPFIKGLEKIVSLIFKENKEEEEENKEFEKFDDNLSLHPTIALEQSNNAVCSMAKKAEDNLLRSINLLDNYSDKMYNTIEIKEQAVDRYEDKLGSFLVKLTQSELSEEQSRKIFKILHTIGDFERIGDHAMNLAKAAKEIHEKKYILSNEAYKEIDILGKAITNIVKDTINAFIHEDINKASRIEPFEQVIDELCDTIKANHILRIQNKNCSLSQGFAFNDILNNYERIADHCSNIAVAMIELNDNKFDTHAYLTNVKSIKSDNFIKDYNFYSKKYSLTNKKSKTK